MKWNRNINQIAHHPENRKKTTTEEVRTWRIVNDKMNNLTHQMDFRNNIQNKNEFNICDENSACSRIQNIFETNSVFEYEYEQIIVTCLIQFWN